MRGLVRHVTVDAGVALDQSRCGMQQERQEHSVGFGLVQRAFQGTPGRGRVTEHVPGYRLQQERLYQPDGPDKRHGAVQDGGKYGRRGARIAGGKAQRRDGDADFPAFAFLLAEPGEDLLGMPGLAEEHQGLHLECPHDGNERVRRGEEVSQPV
jgi:hypothetical protein